MKDLSDSLKATLYERVSSPFHSTFIFSWIIFNWKIVIALLFGDNQLNRVDYVSSIIKSYDEPYMNLLFIPSAIALFLLLLLPIGSNLIYQATLIYKKKRINLKIKYEDETHLNVDQSLELRKELRTVREEIAQEILDKENLSLEAFEQVKLKEEELSDLRGKQIRRKEELSDCQSNVISLKNEILTLKERHKSVYQFAQLISSRDQTIKSTVKLIYEYPLLDIYELFNKIHSEEVDANLSNLTKAESNLFDEIESLKLLGGKKSTSKDPSNSFYTLNEDGKKVYQKINNLTQK